MTRTEARMMLPSAEAVREKLKVKGFVGPTITELSEILEICAEEMADEEEEE